MIGKDEETRNKIDSITNKCIIVQFLMQPQLPPEAPLIVMQALATEIEEATHLLEEFAFMYCLKE